MISVCMATYNGDKYIEQQLDSILKNINSEDELIISDDGSTDRTLEIVKRYCERYPNITVLQGPHEGVIKNFENAIKKSKGEYIFLSDQDDIWNTKKVSEVLKCFDEHRCSVVCHDAILIDANGKKIADSFFELRKSRAGFIHNLYKNSYLGCCMAFTKEHAMKAIPIPVDVGMHDLWIGMLAESYHKSYFLKKKLIAYRRHENNVSSFSHFSFKKMINLRLNLIVEIAKRRKRKSEI